MAVGSPPHKGELDGDLDRRAAATAAYGEELSRALSEDAEVLELLDDEPTRPHQIVQQSSPTQRAMLEPVSEDAHPADHRRVPTHPELLSEALAAIAAGPRPPAVELTAPEPMSTVPPMRAPEPRLVLGANRSPSPVPLRVGLFSADRITNLLAGAAVGLLLTIIPAHKLALTHAQALLTQPLLELNDAIDSPLAVDADLLRKPQAIAAEIEASREAVRTRYLMIWLLAGLPLGLGLSLIPRWWA